MPNHFSLFRVSQHILHIFLRDFAPSHFYQRMVGEYKIKNGLKARHV